MTDKWHLTPESGEIKGNNPYQLSRMTVDPSFRATSAYNLADIQGYSAMGEVILKGEQLHLAPPKEKSCLKSPMGQLLPANANNNVAKYAKTKTSEHFGTSSKQESKIRHQSKIAHIDALVHHQYQQQLLSDQDLSTDWQLAFTQGSTQSHLNNLGELTKSRYDNILTENTGLGRY
jgi:hypothetical protein